MLSNRPSIPSIPKAYVTQTWSSGTSWYRKYSDGWIEQGGMVTYADNDDHTIAFHTVFSTANATVMRVNISTSADGETMRFRSVHSVTATSFGMWCHKSATGSYWYACGY